MIIGLSCALCAETAAAAGGNPVNQMALSDLATVLSDLQKTSPNLDQALADLATTEYDWTYFRMMHPDTPHTPITQDSFLSWTALAINDTTSAKNGTTASSIQASVGRAISDLAGAKGAANYGPPPYNIKGVAALERLCRLLEHAKMSVPDLAPPASHH
jgi:hypothetical protein